MAGLRASKSAPLRAWLTLLVLLVGCTATVPATPGGPPPDFSPLPPASGDQLAQSPEAYPTYTPLPTYTPQPTFTLFPVNIPPPSPDTSGLTILGIPRQFDAKVTKIIDGDTIEVQTRDGNKDEVRLLAVDAPEANRPNKPNQYATITDTICLDYWGLMATQFSASRLEGQWITLILDAGSEDDLELDKLFSAGRLLVFADLNGEDFNALLLERGLASLITDTPSSRDKLYLELQQQAQTSATGLWGCQQGEADAAPATSAAPTASADLALTSAAQSILAPGSRVTPKAAPSSTSAPTVMPLPVPARVPTPIPPTATPPPIPTPTPTPIPPTATPIPVPTRVPTSIPPTATPTPVPTPTPTPIPPTATPTPVPTPTATPIPPTATPTPVPTPTPTPIPPTATPTPVPTLTPTPIPPTATPTPVPTPMPTPIPPTATPTPVPTPMPTPVPPTATPTPVPTPVSPPSTDESCTAGQVDVNSASEEQLELIKHIGPVRAAEMVQLRPFASLDDLVRIKGIAATRLAEIKSQGLACVGR